MIATLALCLLAAGIYATLLGFGKINRPERWRGQEETLWVGRFALFFGFLVLLDSLGITPHQISAWIEDIMTSGGGAGTG